jgi:hypothetical protein
VPGVFLGHSVGRCGGQIWVMWSAAAQGGSGLIGDCLGNCLCACGAMTVPAQATRLAGSFMGGVGGSAHGRAQTYYAPSLRTGVETITLRSRTRVPSHLAVVQLPYAR